MSSADSCPSHTHTWFSFNNFHIFILCNFFSFYYFLFSNYYFFLSYFVSMHEHTFADLNMEFYTTLEVNANDFHILAFRMLGKPHQLTYSFMQRVFGFKKDDNGLKMIRLSLLFLCNEVQVALLAMTCLFGSKYWQTKGQCNNNWMEWRLSTVN